MATNAHSPTNSSAKTATTTIEEADLVGVVMEAKNTGQKQQQLHLHHHHHHHHHQQQQQSQIGGKSLIDKDNLRDEDFDKLVIDISNIVSSSSNSQVALINGQREGKSTTVDSLIVEQCHNSSSNDEANGADGGPTGNKSTADRLNQPKRPMNAFMVWGRAIRREIHLRFSNVQNALLSKALGRVWRSLDSVAKEPYVRKANLIKANHRRDYPDYRYRPRRLLERERNKGNQDEPTTIIVSANQHQPTSQYFVSTDNRPQLSANQQQAPAFKDSQIYSTATNGHRRSPKLEYNKRLGAELEGHSFDQYCVPNFAYQDNNHIDHGGYRNGTIYCGTAGDDVHHLKGQYYDEYQQRRSLTNAKHHPVTAATTAQVYPYPGPYQHQHQFGYTMQIPQQHQHHPHLLPEQQPPLPLPPAMSEATQVTYVESCSLSAAAAVSASNPGLDAGNRLSTLPATAETYTGLAKAYETRN